MSISALCASKLFTFSAQATNTAEAEATAHSNRDADLSQVQVIEAEADTAEAAGESSDDAEATAAVAAPADPKQHLPRPRRASRVASSTEAPVLAATETETSESASVGAARPAAVSSVPEEAPAAATGGDGENSDEEDWAGKADASADDAAESEDTVISGWLKKAGEKNTKFKDRFFVIDGDVFRYYTDDKSYDDAQPPIKNNTVPIPHYRCQVVPKDKSNKRLQLVPVAPSSAKFGARVWTFEAHDETARNFWMQAFWTAGASKQDA